MKRMDGQEPTVSDPQQVQSPSPAPEKQEIKNPMMYVVGGVVVAILITIIIGIIVVNGKKSSPVQPSVIQTKQEETQLPSSASDATSSSLPSSSTYANPFKSSPSQSPVVNPFETKQNPFEGLQ